MPSTRASASSKSWWPSSHRSRMSHPRFGKFPGEFPKSSKRQEIQRVRRRPARPARPVNHQLRPDRVSRNLRARPLPNHGTHGRRWNRWLRRAMSCSSPRAVSFVTSWNGSPRSTAHRAHARERPRFDNRRGATVSEKLERLEARRFGKTNKPRKNLDDADTSSGVRGIAAPVRRFVWQRDSGQCTFVSDDGRRCPERHRLEYHHEEAYGLGGDRSAGNVRLLCRVCTICTWRRRTTAKRKCKNSIGAGRSILVL